MPSPQRKTNTAAFTSALKQVFYIHKNIVAELCAQLDVITDECKLLKANTRVTKSSGKCESCIHLEKMNRSLQEHFNSLLQEKDTGIKTLEKKLQFLTGRANTVSSQTQKGKMLLKEMSYTAAKPDLLLDREQGFSPKISDTSYHPSSRNDVSTPPLNPCSQEEINQCESGMIRGHSKLRLTKHGKRHSHYVEEQRENKRAKISPGAAASSSITSDRSVGSQENNVSGLHETVFVADTVCNTQVRNFSSAHKNVGSVSDNEQSQQLLVVPETLAIDTSSNSGCEHETELEKQDHDDNNPKEVAVCPERNKHSKSFLITNGGHDNRLLQTEDNTLLNDDICDVGNSSADNTVIENMTLSKSMWQTTLSQALIDKDSLIETGSCQRKVGHLDTEEKEKLQIAEAIRRSLTDFNNTQRSSKRSEYTSPESNFSELGKVNIRTARKCNSTNEGKEIARNRFGNSSNIAKLLPLSLQRSSELKNQEHGETTETTKSTKLWQGSLNSAHTNHKNDKVSNFAVLEPNGSLNPEIHLTEYLDSEMTERQTVNQTFCSLDETIAPNLISQYMVGSQQNQDTSQITKLNTETNRNIQIQQMTERQKVNQTFCSLDETIAPNLISQCMVGSQQNQDTSQTTKLNTETNRHIQIQQNDSNDALKDNFWEDGDESIFDNSVFSNDEDDPELIEPSPQQTFQSHSQLHSSIPASSRSFKFIHKKPQIATKPVLPQTGESEMINDEDSVLDESRHLLHEKSDVNLERSTELHMVQNPPSQTLLDSFDRVPKSDDIEFPHVSVVRKKSERSKLQGFSCKQCYEYYKNSGLSEEALQQKKNECSRHRERYQAPETPEHFWSLGFPDTAEMIDRRQKYDSNESPVAASKAPRRRQRLEKKF